MRLTNSQIISLGEAHLNLDGTPEKPFEFTAKFRYALAKNLRLIQQRVRDIELARVRIVVEVNPKNEKLDPNSEQGQLFEKRYEELLQAEVDIPNLMGIKLSELNLEKNPIPIRVLSALGPILTEDVELA